MANTIRIKRGLKANIANLSLLPGEIAVALDTQELYVGDQNGVVQVVKAGTSGSVQSAEKLTTARNIALSGDATGSASFDGSKDIEIALALANSGVTAGTYNNVTVNAKGLITSATNKTYTIEDITGLQEALNTKLSTATYNADMVVVNNSLASLNTGLEGKANSTDVYTKEEVNNKINEKDSLPNQNGNAGKFLTTDGTIASWATVDLSSKADVAALNTAKEELQANIDKKATAATTLTGYGITDAYTKDQVDGMVAGTFHFRGEKTAYNQLPTNAKEGDVWQVGDKEYAWNGNAWIELGFNVDLSGYLTTTSASNTYATKGALTDAQTTLQNNINTKANSADVYDKNAIDTKLSSKAESSALTTKADKATSLSGYGITDAYTKTEINTKVSTLENSIGTKLDTSSVIDGGEFGA